MNTAWCSLGIGVRRVLGRDRFEAGCRGERRFFKMISSWSWRSTSAVGILAFHVPFFTPSSGETNEMLLSRNFGSGDSVQMCSEKKEKIIEKPRPFFTGGNFKMNGNKKDIEDIVKNLKKAKLDPNVEVVISPPSIYLQHLKTLLPKHIELAGQNAWKAGSGAFTGEISPAMIRDVGGSWVILGHSERRQIFGETDELIGDKLCRAFYEKLKVIACIGETLQEREGGEAEEVVLDQLESIARHVRDWSTIVIAYEPVWAIGTGKVATPEEAQQMHCEIRNWVRSNVGECAGDIVRIIYGGSVTAENCLDLAKQEDIDGFLVGGASLKPEFVDIINVIQDHNKRVKEKEKKK